MWCPGLIQVQPSVPFVALAVTSPRSSRITLRVSTWKRALTNALYLSSILETYNHWKFIDRSMPKVLTLRNVSSVTKNIQAEETWMSTRKPIRRGGLTAPIVLSHSNILEIIGNMKRSARRGHPQHRYQWGSSVPCIIGTMCMPLTWICDNAKHHVWQPLWKPLTIFNIFTNFTLDFMIYNNLFLYIYIYSSYLVPYKWSYSIL